MSNVTISFSWGLCHVYRDWCLSELFAADGWYLPGEPKGQVSTGNINNQVGAKDQHLLPMLPSAFLVVGDVQITAMNWGTAFDELHTQQAKSAASGHTDSTSVSGGIGGSDRRRGQPPEPISPASSPDRRVPTTAGPYPDPRPSAP